jgi:hypothetical protein
MYITGNTPHKPRLEMIIEKVHADISQTDLPKGRYYLVLKISGKTVADGVDCTMPPIKYCFM